MLYEVITVIVDGIGLDDRRDGVVEIEVLRAGQVSNLHSQGVGGQRSAGHDHRITLRQVGHLLPAQIDKGVAGDSSYNFV